MADKPPITILVVDDVDASRYTLSRMLKKARFAVKEAATGRDALRLVAEKPDLVILDVNLPDMSGYEVCKKIKADPATSSIPVLHLSASFVESDNRSEGLESGADGYLTYPVEPRELFANIQALLRTRRAEQEAREQRELLQVTLNSIGDGVIATDAHGLVTFLNPVAQALTGWSRDEAASRPLAEVFHIISEATRQRANSPVERVIRDGMIVGLANHTLLVARDGTERPIDDSAAPIRDREGKVAGVVLVFRDVTERRRAEEARRYTEERIQLMVESVKDYAIFAIDPEGRVTTWNSGAERLFGYGEADILGQPVALLYTPEDIVGGIPQQELVRAGSEGRAADERWHLRKDGSRFFASGSVTPLRDSAGHLFGFTKIARDMTERKQAEQEITRLLATKQSQAERLLQVAATSLTVNASLTMESVLGVITADARKIIGAYQVVSILTRNRSWDQALSAVSLSDKYATWRGRDIKPDGGGPWGVVCRTNRPLRLTRAELESHPAWQGFGPGTERHPPLRGWLAAPFIGRNGRNLGLIYLSDKAEDEFTEEDEAILVQVALIASVAIENAQLYQELRDADRRKDEFLAILAHELRNPLAPIRNALQVMRLAGTDKEVVGQARGLIDRQVGQMVRLIDDLLDLSRISRGRIALRLERVELATVVGAALESSRPFVEEAGHELSVSLPPKPIYLRADLTRLAQVLMNLLNNAAKYTERGGRIELRAERDLDRRVTIRVKDTGVGIPPDMLGRIFEMFAQVDRSLERAQGGLGIGLTLVRTLVDMHGGSVEAHSAGPGLGSEFLVRLPVISGEPLAVAPQDLEGGGRQEPALPKRRILAVDDNRDSAESMAMLLKMIGNDVCTAHDGPGAVAAAASYQPDVVLLDIGLPGMSGYEVARQIRRQRPQGVVLVAVTGWGQEEDRRRSQEAGFDHHLVKPVDLNALQKLLTSLKPPA